MTCSTFLIPKVPENSGIMIEMQEFGHETLHTSKHVPRCQPRHIEALVQASDKARLNRNYDFKLKGSEGVYAACSGLWDVRLSASRRRVSGFGMALGFGTCNFGVLRFDTWGLGLKTEETEALVREDSENAPIG